MTVCIGSICNEGKGVVVAADKMVTVSLPPTEFEHPGSKIEKLYKNTLFLIAGQLLPAAAILDLAKEKLKSKSDIKSIAEIAKIVADVYREYRLLKVEEAWLAPRKLSLQSFYNEGKANSIPQNLSLALDQQMVSFNLGVDLIIAGIDESGGHLFTVNNPGVFTCHDKIGYATIGSGSMHAMASFIFNNYSKNFELNRGVFYTFEAKKKAETAPGVGQKTNMSIITAAGIKDLDEEDVAILFNKFNEIRNPRLAEELKCIEELPYGKEAINEPAKQ